VLNGYDLVIVIHRHRGLDHAIAISQPSDSSWWRGKRRIGEKEPLFPHTPLGDPMAGSTDYRRHSSWPNLLG
jgi:hypothetical protein